MTLKAEDQQQLDHWFEYHPPKGDQAERYTRLRAGAKQFAELIVELCPASADRTAALRKLREVVFTSNASIACEGR
jgi:hypothetical protein